MNFFQHFKKQAAAKKIITITDNLVKSYTHLLVRQRQHFVIVTNGDIEKLTKCSLVNYWSANTSDFTATDEQVFSV